MPRSNEELVELKHNLAAYASEKQLAESIAVTKAARELIKDPAHWTKRALARDAEGHCTPYTGDDAVAFCILGSINRARYLAAMYYEHWSTRVLEAVASPSRGIAWWNDVANRSHKTVLSKFDETEKILAEALSARVAAAHPVDLGGEG